MSQPGRAAAPSKSAATPARVDPPAPKELAPSPAPPTPPEPSRSLPLDEVVLSIPITRRFPLRSDGQPNDGDTGFIDGRLGGTAAKGLQRVVLAMQAKVNEGGASRFLPPYKSEVSRIDAVRFVFAAIEHAATTEGK